MKKNMKLLKLKIQELFISFTNLISLQDFFFDVMIKQILFLTFILSIIQVNAQTGIGTTTPNASAKLDVYATNKGFLPPRVTLTSVTDASTITSPAEGLLVYNTGANINLAAGYYYWNGSNWATIATASSPNQTVDYVSVTRTTLQTVSVGGNILFNQINGGNIPYNTSTGLFTLTAGKTYRLTGCIAVSSSNASAEEVNVAWKNGNGDFLANKGEALSTNFGTTGFANGVADVIYTPSVNTTVSLTVTYSSSSVVLWGNFTYANIQQIGSSAIVNPWVLSGNDVYNTSGKVGIGTNTPSAKLDITGDVNVVGALNVSGSSNVNLATPALLVGNGSGDEGGEIQLAKAATNTSLTSKVIIDIYRNQLRLWEGGTNSKGVSIDLSKAPDGVGGELVWKKSGFVDAGTYLTLDNLKVSVTTGGSRGLSVGAVTGSFVCNISGWYAYGGSSGSSAESITYTTTPSGSAFGWSFGAAGNTAQYHILDLTNNRFYRVTMMIGSSYINNFISIERLY